MLCHIFLFYLLISANALKIDARSYVVNSTLEELNKYVEGVMLNYCFLFWRMVFGSQIIFFQPKYSITSLWLMCSDVESGYIHQVLSI